MKRIFLIIWMVILGQTFGFGQFFSPTYTTPPTVPNVRTMAEWEEIEALVVTWTGQTTGFSKIVKQIIQHAKEEVRVIVVCSDSNVVIPHLSASNITTDNIDFIEGVYNSVWVRDYGATTIYGNQVDSIYLVDWIYNRPRPLDDGIPTLISDYKNIPLYSTTSNPYDLVNTGGNFMSDGQGTAFASRLIIAENGPFGQYNPTIKTEIEIDSVMKEFMGIDQFIKTELVPYNNINHIDMYMKLLNEETLLVGEYPQGVADGPQIEANIQHIQDNYQSVFGTPYRIIRVPMPPDTCGNYPDFFGTSCLGGPPIYRGHYRTYTNFVFINKTVLVPVYSYQHDTTALNVLRKELPGYKVIGIDCDEMIGFGGALHCITKAVGVKNPLLMVHQPIRDTIVQQQGYDIKAKFQHNSQIKKGTLYYTTDTALGFTALSMFNLSAYNWQANIPTQPAGTIVYYYIKAESYSGKEQVRPITAPTGFWQFEVQSQTNTKAVFASTFEMDLIYPNPSGDKIFIPINNEKKIEAKIELVNLAGQTIKTIHQGMLFKGHFIFETIVNDLPSGIYFVALKTKKGTKTRKIIVK